MINVRGFIRGIGRDRLQRRPAGDDRDRPDVPAAQQLIPDEATIGRLRRFSLNHGLRPVDGLVGEHRSRRRGAAPEFSDFSRYTPGDDIRRIDWNAYARFETLYVRESEITTELDMHLLVDTSASMNWSGSRERETKRQTAQRIGALLAWIALSRSDRVSITGIGDGVPETFGPVQGRGMVVPAAARLAGLEPGGAASLVDAVDAYVRARPKSGILVIISDLIGVTTEDLDRVLARLANGRWRTAIIHVEDPLESDPVGLAEAHEVLEIQDPETGLRQRINLQPETVSRYVRGRDAWLADLAATASRRSVPLIRISNRMRMDPDVLLRLERAGVIVS